MVEVALLGLRADRVDPLDVRGRAERGDGQRLGLTAREQTRAVGARHEADLDRDRPDVRQAAAVDPDALVEHDPADRLLLDQAEQGLADSRLTPGRLEELGGVAAGPVRPHGLGDRLAEGGDATREVVGEPDQEVGGRLGIRKGAVALRELDPEEPRQIAELVRLGAGIPFAGDHQGVDV